MAYFDLSKLNLVETNIYTESVRNVTVMVTDVIKWHWGPYASKMSIQDHQNKNRLSACKTLLLQQKLKPGRTKPLTGPQVGHSWYRSWVHKRFSKGVKFNHVKVPMGQLFLLTFFTVKCSLA